MISLTEKNKLFCIILFGSLIKWSKLIIRHFKDSLSYTSYQINSCYDEIWTLYYTKLMHLEAKRTGQYAVGQQYYYKKLVEFKKR